MIALEILIDVSCLLYSGLPAVFFFFFEFSGSIDQTVYTAFVGVLSKIPDGLFSLE